MSFLIDFSDDPHRVAEYLAAALNEWPKMRKRNGYSTPPEVKAAFKQIAAAALRSTPQAGTNGQERAEANTDSLSAEPETYADDDMLTVDQARRHLDVDESTIRRWVRREELPAVRYGRTIRIRFADLKSKEKNPCH